MIWPNFSTSKDFMELFYRHLEKLFVGINNLKHPRLYGLLSASSEAFVAREKVGLFFWYPLKSAMASVRPSLLPLL